MLGWWTQRISIMIDNQLCTRIYTVYLARLFPGCRHSIDKSGPLSSRSSKPSGMNVDPVVENQVDPTG